MNDKLNSDLEEIINIRSADEDTPLIVRFFNYFGTSIVAALIFLFLSWEPVDNYFIKHIPNKKYRLVAKALILFIFVYISNRIIVRHIQKRYKERMKIKLIDLLERLRRDYNL